MRPSTAALALLAFATLAAAGPVAAAKKARDAGEVDARGELAGDEDPAAPPAAPLLPGRVAAPA